MGVIFGIIMAILLITTGAISKERVKGARTNYENFLETIISFFKLREFRRVSGLYLFNAIGSGIIMALSIFFLSDVLKVGVDAAGFMAFPLVTAFCFDPFWSIVSNRARITKCYIYDRSEEQQS